MINIVFLAKSMFKQVCYWNEAGNLYVCLAVMCAELNKLAYKRLQNYGHMPYVRKNQPYVYTYERLKHGELFLSLFVCLIIVLCLPGENVTYAAAAGMVVGAGL